MNYDYDASYLDSPETFETLESEAWPMESYDFSEARRRRPAPVRPASGASTFRPRPGGGGGAAGGGSVTQAQLEAALARVREQITANANAIKTIDGRVRTVISDTQKLQAMTKKDVDKLRADLRNTQTLSALIPLIAKPGTTIGQVAPLLHLVGSDMLGTGGQGSSTSGSGSLLGGSNANLITIGALLYASGVFDKKQ